MNAKDKEILQKREDDFKVFIRANKPLLDEYEDVILSMVFYLLDNEQYTRRMQHCHFLKGVTIHHTYYINRYYDKERKAQLVAENLSSLEREKIESFDFDLDMNYSGIPEVTVMLVQKTGDKDKCSIT